MAGQANPMQGEVWDIDFNPIVGHEQGGRRPALIISHNRFNGAANELCIVVPLTSRERGLASEIAIDPPEGGVTQRSVILTNQIRTVSHARLERRRGWVNAETLNEVLTVVQALVQLSPKR